MYLKNEIDKINNALRIGFGGDVALGKEPLFTSELQGLAIPRETQTSAGALKYLADVASDRKVSISDKFEISVLHVFGNEIQYDALETGRGDGKRYASASEVTLVAYAAKAVEGFFPYVETALSRLPALTLVKTSFDAKEIRENFLFLEKDINHDRELFAITYRIRVNTCDKRKELRRKDGATV